MSPAWHAKVAGVPKVTLRFHVGPDAYEEVLVRLSENRNAAVREQAGADETELVLDANLSDPSELPAGVTPGMTSTVEIDGVTGTAKLLPTVDSRIDAARKATGRKIRLLWSSDAA